MSIFRYNFDATAAGIEAAARTIGTATAESPALSPRLQGESGSHKKNTMEIIPKTGTDLLQFGMRRKDVEKIFGPADREFMDDEQNVIWLYDKSRMRLTFYADEEFRFGYLICSNPDATLFANPVISSEVEMVKATLAPKGFVKWEIEDFDLTTNHFNEANWLILQSEFGTVTKVELGAIINDKDEFAWKFK